MHMTEIITYEEGTCFDKKAQVNKIGNKIQYIFFSFFIANTKQ